MCIHTVNLCVLATTYPESKVDGLSFLGFDGVSHNVAVKSVWFIDPKQFFTFVNWSLAIPLWNSFINSAGSDDDGSQVSFHPVLAKPPACKDMCKQGRMNSP